MSEFLANHHVVSGLDNAGAFNVDITGGTLCTDARADRICMKGYNKATFLIFAHAWAGGTSLIEFTQATDVANSLGDSKPLLYPQGHYVSTTFALGVAPLWVHAVTTGAIANFLTIPATANRAYAIEIPADSLDVDNGFDCIQIVPATPGVNTDILQVIVILSELRHGGDEATMVNPVID